MMTAQKKRIVYIEDEPEMIRLVRLIFRHEPIELIGAVGGLDGLALIQSLKPDLVLLDLMMPGLDGWEVYQRMKEHTEMKDIPVIVVTVRSTRVDRALGLHIKKVDGYITKPFELNDLIDNVHDVLYRSHA
ncbi:MAG: response regulator [Anaerolineae bacterium]|nr:response regulator [Anaerolineae bacterium]